MEASWTKSPEDILEHFRVDPVRGLTSDQAAKHSELYGKNGTLLTITIYLF
jgi:Ca2+ transporting ATPase